MKTILTFVFLLAFRFMAFAQTIEGAVIDSATKKPLEFITINLKAGDKAVSTLSNSKGYFKLTPVKALAYTLQIAGFGFQTQTISVDLSDGKNKNIGIIILSAQSRKLAEVQIKAARQIINRDIDGITYNMQADPDSKSSNLLDMVRKVPYLSLDANDNVQLKGNSDFKILVNGKPSSMLERNLKDILRSMPASSIEKIEVITSPSAKYDAEGQAGVINIITVKKTANGYSGNLNFNERFTVGGPAIGGGFSLKEGPLAVAFLVGGSLYHNPLTETSNQRSASTELDQSGATKSDSHTSYMGTEISYDVDTLNLLTAQFNLNGNHTNGNSYFNSILTGTSGLLQHYYLNNDNDLSGKGLDAGLNWQHAFAHNKNKLFTLSYHYLNNQTDQNNRIGLSDRFNYTVPDYSQTNENSNSEHTVQADFVQGFKILQLEAGIKAIFRGNSSDFSNGPTLDAYDNTQDILGAYNVYSFKIGAWGIKAGARLEQTIVDANFSSNNSLLHQNYLNLIPTLAISRTFKDQSSLNFGFAQRLKRPGITRLNPYVDRSNPNFEITGNPELRATVINTLQAGYSKSGKLDLNIGVDYSFANNLILRLTTYDAARNVSVLSYQNIGKGGGLNGSIYMTYALTKAWSLNLNTSLGYNWLQAVTAGTLVKVDQFAYNVLLASGYRFDKGWRISANINNISGNITSLQGRSNALLTSSFTLSKELVKNKLSFAVTTSNPFTKYRYSVTETNGAGFLETNSVRVYYRTFGASLNYSFGKIRDAVKKNKRGIKNDDLAN